MDTIESERAKYAKVWKNPDYRRVSPAMRHLDHALGWLDPAPGASFTDWGSGSGKASDAMHERGFKVRMVDIAPNAYTGSLPVIEACLWDLPSEMGATDYGICCDVMEHIPPEHVDAVLQEIAERTNVAVFFQIALFHDNTFTHAGPLHLSVFSVEDWQTRILSIYSKAEFIRIKAKHLLVKATP